MNNSQSTEKDAKALEEKTNNVALENNVVDENSSVVTEVKTEENAVTTETKSETETKVEDEKKTEETKAETTPSVPAVVEKKSDEDEIQLKNLDKNFIYEVMSIPSYSGAEYRMVQFIILWARRNGIKYEFDNYGNVYLTKGELAKGEFYPCMSSHLDTVQNKAKTYAEAGSPLTIKTRKCKGKHEIYVDGMGIGADDKAGVLISLSMFSKFDKMKAAFFLEEETGCLGSKVMNVNWFKDVAYVMGWDSPEQNRAAYAVSGVKLFDKDFFVDHMQEICKKHGLTTFNSEPFTDVKQIREKTDLICMNFGNGGYDAHMATEYCVLEDMDIAFGMGVELVEHLGTKTQYKLKHVSTSGGWQGNVYVNGGRDADEDFFYRLKYPHSTTSYGSSSTGGSYHHGYNDYDYTHRSSGGTSASGSTSTTQQKKEETVSIEALRYVTEKYGQHLDDLKNALSERCTELGVDFSKFSDLFNSEIKF